MCLIAIIKLNKLLINHRLCLIYYRHPSLKNLFLILNSLRSQVLKTRVLPDYNRLSIIRIKIIIILKCLHHQSKIKFKKCMSKPKLHHLFLSSQLPLKTSKKCHQQPPSCQITQTPPSKKPKPTISS